MMSADEILDALIAVSSDKIWAVEVPFRGSSTRIDFWTLKPTQSGGFRTISYEIKISKSDFRRDNEDKQRGALDHSDRFFYVCPDGLLSKADIPDWAGLMTFDGKMFKVLKNAPKREKIEPSWGVIVDVIRNSGQCRRDIDLLASQLSYAKHRLNFLETSHNRIGRVQTERWTRRFANRPLKQTS